MNLSTIGIDPLVSTGKHPGPYALIGGVLDGAPLGSPAARHIKLRKEPVMMMRSELRLGDILAVKSGTGLAYITWAMQYLPGYVYRSDIVAAAREQGVSHEWI